MYRRGMYEPWIENLDKTLIPLISASRSNRCTYFVVRTQRRPCADLPNGPIVLLHVSARLDGQPFAAAI